MELSRVAANAGGRALASGAAYRFDGEWTVGRSVRLLREVIDVPLSSNVIEMNAAGPRSNTPAPLSLHQEDYHLVHRPRVLALLCVECETDGGSTLVARLDPSMIPDRLRHERIRYYRHSVGEWTPWHPIVETVDGEVWHRVTMPDEHRTVEVSAGREAFGALVEAIQASVEPVGWTPGTLLVVDNRIAVHGRAASRGGRRKLIRWVG